MAYMDTMRARLGESDRYAVKIETRGDDESGATHWIGASPDQVKRIMEILSEDDRVYVLTAEDVGKATIQAFGRTWRTVDFIGRIQLRDVGKRVFRRETNADDSSFLQVESNEQRDRRLNR